MPLAGQIKKKQAIEILEKAGGTIDFIIRSIKLYLEMKIRPGFLAQAMLPMQ